MAAPGDKHARSRADTHGAESPAKTHDGRADRVNPTNASDVPNTTTSPELTEEGPASYVSYQIIAERNIFNLQPVPPPPPPPAVLPLPPPKEDLQLTGLCNLFSARMALFKIEVAGQPPASFTVAEGDQNEWLEVLSVNMADQTANIRLKKPVMRIRSTGTEVLLKLPTR